MSETAVTNEYLPLEHLGAVEALLLARGGSLVAPIYTADEVEASMPLRLCAAPIGFCIGNLTRRFPDGPTYFAISHSTAVNALIARFAGFQCIVVAQGVHVRATVLLVSLLAWEPLRMFLATGLEPREPTSKTTRSREEALTWLVENSSPITDEVRGLTASVAFFLLYMLTAHEIGHLALGHLGQHADSGLDEVGESDEPKVESRAQEWDADGFALTGSLYLTGSEFRLRPVWRELLNDNEAGLRVVIVAAYVLFTLMDSMAPQDRPPEERTHPRPLVRAVLASMTLAAVMEHAGSVGGQVVMDTSRKAIRAVEIALHELAQGVMEEELALKLGEEAQAEADRLIDVLGGDLWDTLDRSRLDGLFWAQVLKVRPAQ